MYTKDEFTERIKRVSELTGDNEDVMNILKDIQDSTLSLYEKEEIVVDDKDNDGVTWHEKYDDMVRRYRNRFFTNEEEIKENQIADINKDNESDKTEFDELFKTREGDYKEEK